MNGSYLFSIVNFRGISEKDHCKFWQNEHNLLDYRLRTGTGWCKETLKSRAISATSMCGVTAEPRHSVTTHSLCLTSYDVPFFGTEVQSQGPFGVQP